MSKSAIEEKLLRQLSSDEPFTEMRIVYILVEIRKLIEREEALKKQENEQPACMIDQKEEYKAWKDERLKTRLSFYCDWAAHTEMTREGAKRLLRLFDKAHPFLSKDKQLPPDLDGQITNLVNLRSFEQGLLGFLSVRSLPTNSLRNRWAEVLHSYAAVIEDCPMTIKNEAELLKNVKSVTVKKEEAEKTIMVGDETHMVFRIRWLCCGHDGSEGSVNSYNTVAMP